MSKKKVDLGGDGKPLTDNPFAGLQGLRDGLPDGGSNPTNDESSAPAGNCESRPYSISRTRKGGMPISLEHRPGNKVVTVIRNVSGDAQALLSMLKRKCGAGGVVRDGAVEIQGDHRTAIEAFLAPR